MKTIILLAMLTIGLSSIAQIKGMEAYKTVMLKGAIGEGVYPDYPYRVTTDIPNALINGDYIFPGKTLDEAVAEAVRILSVNGVPEMPYVIKKKFLDSPRRHIRYDFNVYSLMITDCSTPGDPEIQVSVVESWKLP